MADVQPVDDALIGQLPLHFRLALSYAPAAARNHWLTALAFDARLGNALRQASEPVMAQLRLAWWRDRLSEVAAAEPAREPLLARLKAWPDAGRGLVALVDGWEALLEEAPISVDGIETFVAGRVSLISALCGVLASDRPDHAVLAREWALADLMVHLSDATEQARVRAKLDEIAGSGPRSGRGMRPLAILAAVSRLAARRGDVRMLHSPMALMTAMKVGFFG